VHSDTDDVDGRPTLLATCHGNPYCERSTLMANLVMPLTFARSITWTTSPW
jgi:hypothetical protein